jgi:hypothetical protein
VCITAIPAEAEPIVIVSMEVWRKLQIRDAALSDPEKTYTNDDFEREVGELNVLARQRGDRVTSEVNLARGQSFPPR